MTVFSGDLFDGRSSQAHPVSASLDGRQLHLTGENIALVFSLEQIDIAPPVGAARGVVHLPEGRELHSTDLTALAALSQATATNRPERWARHLESRLGYALVALLVSVLVLFAGLLQFTAGLLKLGQWFRAVSPAVIHGMLAGIGILILVAQFHVMLDGKPIGTGLQNLAGIPHALMDALSSGDSRMTAGGVGLLTITTILGWSSFAPKSWRVVPAPFGA